MSLLWLCSLAFADIPPPPGYIEECTVEKKGGKGKECRECSASFGGREACEALESEGFAKECQTAGASVWTEVMCKASANPPSEPTAPADPSSSRCDQSGGGALASVGLALAALLGRSRRRAP